MIRSLWPAGKRCMKRYRENLINRAVYGNLDAVGRLQAVFYVKVLGKSDRSGG